MVKECIYLGSFLLVLDEKETSNVKICNDSAIALKLAQIPIFHNRIKYIDIKFHFIRDALRNIILDIRHVFKDDMVADILTEGLPRHKHDLYIEELKMIPPENLTRLSGGGGEVGIKEQLLLDTIFLLTPEGAVAFLLSQVDHIQVRKFRDEDFSLVC